MRLFTFLIATAASFPAFSATPKKPNIILILADDLGYSDLGIYGSEIHTPNLDQLASDGIRFRQFYNNSISAPTRASILTGQYPHKAGVGYFSNNLGLPAYQGYLNQSSLTLGEVLQTAGYRTLLSGKWHVAGKKDGKDVSRPWQRGFDESFNADNGSYFDQGDYIPKSSKASNREFQRKGVYYLNGKPYSLKPGSYYVTDLVTDKALSFLREKSDKPFFLYLAYTAPHWPLHAKPEDIAKYKGKYDEGWDELRKQRFERLKKSGLIPDSFKISNKDKDIYDWKRLSYDRKKLWAKKMEVFAAMVDCLDQNVGRILNELKKRHIDDNTLVIFISDNGAPAENLETWFGGAIRNSGPVGSIGSFESQSKNWSYVSNTPFRAFKDYVYEGGISSPFIARFPSRIKRGTIVDGTGHIIDLAPTFYELAGAVYPTPYNNIKTNPLAGKSLLPVLFGKEQQVKRNAPLFWERAGNRAIRDGKWKLESHYPNYQWELYNIEEDRGETKNVAAEHHDIVSQLSTKYFHWADSTGVVDFSKLEKKEPVMMKKFRESKIQHIPNSRF